MSNFNLSRIQPAQLPLDRINRNFDQAENCNIGAHGETKHDASEFSVFSRLSSLCRVLCDKSVRGHNLFYVVYLISLTFLALSCRGVIAMDSEKLRDIKRVKFYNEIRNSIPITRSSLVCFGMLTPVLINCILDVLTECRKSPDQQRAKSFPWLPLFDSMNKFFAVIIILWPALTVMKMLPFPEEDERMQMEVSVFYLCSRFYRETYIFGIIEYALNRIGHARMSWYTSTFLSGILYTTMQLRYVSADRSSQSIVANYVTAILGAYVLWRNFLILWDTFNLWRASIFPLSKTFYLIVYMSSMESIMAVTKLFSFIYFRTRFKTSDFGGFTHFSTANDIFVVFLILTHIIIHSRILQKEIADDARNRREFLEDILPCLDIVDQSMHSLKTPRLLHNVFKDKEFQEIFSNLHTAVNMANDRFKAMLDRNRAWSDDWNMRERIPTEDECRSGDSGDSGDDIDYDVCSRLKQPHLLSLPRFEGFLAQNSSSDFSQDDLNTRDKGEKAIINIQRPRVKLFPQSEDINSFRDGENSINIVAACSEGNTCKAVAQVGGEHEGQYS